MDDEVWDAIPGILGGLLDHLKVRQNYPHRILPKPNNPKKLRSKIGTFDLDDLPPFEHFHELFVEFRSELFELCGLTRAPEKLKDVHRIYDLYQRHDDVLAYIGILCERFAEDLAERIPSEETAQIIPTTVGDAIDLPAYVKFIYGMVLSGYICGDPVLDASIEPLKEQLIEGALVGSQITREEAENRPDKLKLPDDKSDPMLWIQGTPFETIVNHYLAYPIPDSMRFEHQHIVAGSGWGKTQTIQNFIAYDLPAVAEGKASVIVIDSQGDLINNISRLRWFYNGALEDKLTLIEPKDIEYPVVLNLFDVNRERVGDYSSLIQEQILNGTIELYDFVFGSLLGAEMTSKQGTLFRYIMRLMLQIPDANIHTFRKLMEPDGYERYRPYIERLDGTARAFFETEFDSREFKQTKSQVLRRLWGILENRTFERMFSHPNNKLDLFSEMNEGRMILISTSKDLLKQNGSQIFGRFFIAMIVQACLERAALPPDKRTPCYVYIDEAQDYLDENVALILEQARKYNVGVIMAHQYLGQLSPKLQEAFAANTSIKMAGGVSARDARAMAAEMRCGPEYIEKQPRGSFAISLRGKVLSYKTKLGLMEGLDHMTEEQFAEIRDEMRAKYAVHYSQIREQDERMDEHPESNTDIVEPEEDPTKPASSW